MIFLVFKDIIIAIIVFPTENYCYFPIYFAPGFCDKGNWIHCLFIGKVQWWEEAIFLALWSQVQAVPPPPHSTFIVNNCLIPLLSPNLKVNLYEMFCLKWLGKMKTSWLRTNFLKYFFILVCFICRGSWLFMTFAYSQYTNRFHVFSVYKQIHFAHSQYTNIFMPCFQQIYSEILFEDIPYSAYSLYMYKFTLHIPRIKTDSLRIFSV